MINVPPNSSLEMKIDPFVYQEDRNRWVDPTGRIIVAKAHCCGGWAVFVNKRKTFNSYNWERVMQEAIKQAKVGSD